MESQDWVGELDKLDSVKQIRVLWAHAKKAGADQSILDQLEARASELSDSEGGGS